MICFQFNDTQVYVLQFNIDFSKCKLKDIGNIKYFKLIIMLLTEQK